MILQIDDAHDALFFIHQMIFQVDELIEDQDDK